MRYIWGLYTLKIRTYNVKLHRDISNSTKEKTWLLLYQKRLFVFFLFQPYHSDKSPIFAPSKQETIIDS